MVHPRARSWYFVVSSCGTSWWRCSGTKSSTMKEMGWVSKPILNSYAHIVVCVCVCVCVRACVQQPTSQKKINHAKMTEEYPRYSDIFSVRLSETERNMLMVCTSFTYQHIWDEVFAIEPPNEGKFSFVERLSYSRSLKMNWERGLEMCP